MARSGLGYSRQFGIDKLQWIVTGGNSGQESIRNGVFNLEGKCQDNDIIVIHDGIRPLVDDFVLTDVIEMAQQKGNAVTSMPYNEQIFIVNPDDPSTTCKYIPRETLRRVATPQAYRSRNWTGHTMRRSRRRLAFMVLPTPTP